MVNIIIINFIINHSISCLYFIINLKLNLMTQPLLYLGINEVLVMYLIFIQFIQFMKLPSSFITLLLIFKYYYNKLLAIYVYDLKLKVIIINILDNKLRNNYTITIYMLIIMIILYLIIIFVISYIYHYLINIMFHYIIQQLYQMILVLINQIMLLLINRN